MFYRRLHTSLDRYDRYFTSVVARLPIRLQPLSVRLGRLTLPSIWAFALLLTSLSLAANGQPKLAFLGAITIVCIPIGTVVKLLVRRSRPKTLYARNMRIQSYSFPSSHAYASTIAGGYFTILSLSLLSVPLGAVVAAIIITLVAAVGISRVHVGAHYPSDVTAGWLLGVVILGCILQMYN